MIFITSSLVQYFISNLTIPHSVALSRSKVHRTFAVLYSSLKLLTIRQKWMLAKFNLPKEKMKAIF